MDGNDSAVDWPKPPQNPFALHCAAGPDSHASTLQVAFFIRKLACAGESPAVCTKEGVLLLGGQGPDCAAVHAAAASGEAVQQASSLHAPHALSK